MIARCLQRFFVAFFFALAGLVSAAEVQPGAIASLKFRDVDGNTLSTADGHITIITVITRDKDEEAQAVADKMPDRCTGDPKCRYVTLVNFQGKIMRPLRGLTRAIIRNRLETEGRKLQAKYDARGIAREARKDIFVIADFDGAALHQLGLTPEASTLGVFVFGPQGKLVARWNEVPPGDSLAKAIAAAEE